jgi:hypothetical protein
MMYGDPGDYWFRQRYDALMFAEHEKGHPDSDPGFCVHCPDVAEGTFVTCGECGVKFVVRDGRLAHPEPLCP